jgi:hypothetical protein
MTRARADLSEKAVSYWAYRRSCSQFVAPLSKFVIAGSRVNLPMAERRRRASAGSEVIPRGRFEAKGFRANE